MPGGDGVSPVGRGRQRSPGNDRDFARSGHTETREDDRIFNRQYSVRSLEEIGNAARAAIPVLVEATKDGDAETRVCAAKASLSWASRWLRSLCSSAPVADQSVKGSVREMARRELGKLKAKRDAERHTKSDDSVRLKL